MLKHLIISYSNIPLDSLNNFAIFAQRKYPKTVFLNSSVLTTHLNLVFRYLNWYKKNHGRVLFLVNVSDLIYFSNFVFFCSKVPNCEVQALDNLTRLNCNYENTVVVSLFLTDSLFDFIQQESKRLNFPLISFSFINSNSHRSAQNTLLADNFYSKIITLNMLILSLTTNYRQTKNNGIQK